MLEHNNPRFLRKEMSDRIRKVLTARRVTLSALLNGSAFLATEMALRIERAFGVSMDMPLRIRGWRDATMIRMRETVCE